MDHRRVEVFGERLQAAGELCPDDSPVFVSFDTHASAECRNDRQASASFEWLLIKGTQDRNVRPASIPDLDAY